jgi:hypothetical protein
MMFTDENTRRRLAARVASGELSLVKLRERIDGRPPRTRPATEDIEDEGTSDEAAPVDDRSPGEEAWTGHAAARSGPLPDDSLVLARHQLADAVEELVQVLRSQDVLHSIPDVDRANLAKYLTIAKLKLENAIAMVRSGDSGD